MMKFFTLLKTHANAFALLLALLLLITTATGCTESFANDASDESDTGEGTTAGATDSATTGEETTAGAETTDESTEPLPEVEMPSEALLEKMKEDYFHLLYDSHPFYENVEYDPETSVTVRKCFGIYNGCIGARMTSFDEVFHDTLVDEEVAGVIIHYTSSQKIKVWKDGSFYSLQEAYDAGLLTKSDIETIAKIQNVWWQES